MHLSMYNNYYAVFLLSLLAFSNSFPQFSSRKLVSIVSAHKNISGSFFNPIPNRDDEDHDETDNNMKYSRDLKPEAPYHSNMRPDPFDQSFSELLKKKNPSSHNLKAPSNDRGVGSAAKAIGFGKANGGPEANIIKTLSTKKSFVGIGKPLNDITKPEFDEQGYTLYADEETGERKRVFEALVQYPCNFTMKIIGDPSGNFASEIVQVVASTCEVTFESVQYSERKYGKWISVTVKAPVTSAEMLYSIYENIDKDPRVKFKF